MTESVYYVSLFMFWSELSSEVNLIAELECILFIFSKKFLPYVLVLVP